jgi:hypothetical protein
MHGWKPILSVSFVILGIGYLIFAADAVKEPEKRSPIKIHVEDLCNGKYEIIGKLGKSCGEVLRIRGIWSARDNSTKEGFRTLRITHIDGKKLTDIQPIVISEANVQPAKSRKDNWPPKEGIYEGRVYERCGYLFGQPQKVERILNEPTIQTSHTYGFECYLYLIDQ